MKGVAGISEVQKTQSKDAYIYSFVGLDLQQLAKLATVSNNEDCVAEYKASNVTIYYSK